MSDLTKEKLKKNRKSSLWWMYTPILLIISFFIIYPFLDGIRISFTDWDGFSKTFNYVGFDQYKRLLTDPDTWVIVRNTLLYGVGSTLFQNIIGLIYAIILDQNIRFKNIARTIIFIPVIVSPLIMGYIWFFFFAYQDGALNDILLSLGLEPSNLLSNATINSWVIVFVNTYQFVGIAMIIYLAGLQSIPRDFYESADIDGASSFSKFKNITIPLLMPSITINIILNIIGGLKLFDVIISLTNGGPGNSSQSLSTYMYDLYFAKQDAGYAATQGVLMVVIILVISLVALFYLRRKEVEA